MACAMTRRPPPSAHRILIEASKAQDVEQAIRILSKHIADAGCHCVDQRRMRRIRAARAAGV